MVKKSPGKSGPPAQTGKGSGTGEVSRPSRSASYSLEYLKGLRFLFDDPNWANNLLIGSVIIFIPIVGSLVVMGWQCEIYQRLHKKISPPIPKLDFGDFVYYLQRGIAPFLVSLIITFPLTLILIFIGVIAGFGFALLAQQGAPVATLVPLGLIGGGAVFLFILIPAVAITNGGLTRAYLTEDIGKSLELGKIWSYAKQTWRWAFMAALVYLPVFFILMMAGSAVLYFGMYPAMLIMNVAWIHLSWQIYEIYLNEGGEEIPLKQGVQPIPSEAKKT